MKTDFVLRKKISSHHVDKCKICPASGSAVNNDELMPDSDLGLPRVEIAGSDAGSGNTRVAGHCKI